jgi:hypothetical protein
MVDLLNNRTRTMKSSARIFGWGFFFAFSAHDRSLYLGKLKKVSSMKRGRSLLGQGGVGKLWSYDGGCDLKLRRAI